MNPFIWIMALRGAWRAAQEYDKTTPTERDAYFDALHDRVAKPREYSLLRRPFRIVLYILLAMIFLSMVIGGGH